MFCSKFFGKIKSIFRQFDTYVSEHVAIALQVTTAIRDALSGTASDILLAVIPGDLDAVIRDKVVIALNKAIDALAIIDACKQYTNVADKLQCFIREIKKHNPAVQEALLMKLSSLIAAELDEGKLKQNLYDLFAQAQYSAGK